MEKQRGIVIVGVIAHVDHAATCIALAHHLHHTADIIVVTAGEVLNVKDEKKEDPFTMPPMLITAMDLPDYPEVKHSIAFKKMEDHKLIRTIPSKYLTSNNLPPKHLIGKRLHQKKGRK